MKRAILSVVILCVTVFSAASAEAHWPHYRIWGGGWFYSDWGCGPWDCCGPVWGGCYDPFPYGNGLSFLHPKPIAGFVVRPPNYTPFSYRPLDDSLLMAVRQTDGKVSLPETDLPRVLVRIASIEQRRKAERMLAEGDELFRAQKFHSALQRYKLAASTAPDLAEAQWRKGHALVATHNYELAVAAFKRAVVLSDDVSRGGFRLGELYGPAAMTKQIQLDSLAEWALSKTGSGDAWFLVGVFLYYDGQQARSEKFFTRALDLGGSEMKHLTAFSRPAGPVPAHLTSTPVEL